MGHCYHTQGAAVGAEFPDVDTFSTHLLYLELPDCTQGQAHQLAHFADTQVLFMMFKVPGKDTCSDLSKKICQHSVSKKGIQYCQCREIIIRSAILGNWKLFLW